MCKVPKIFLSVAVSVLIFSSCCSLHGSSVSANDKVLTTATIKLTGNETMEQRKALAKVTTDQAKTTALQHVAGGKVDRIDLDNEKGYLVYSVDIIKDGKSNDVKIDAGDGKFLFVDTEKDTGVEGKE